MYRFKYGLDSEIKEPLEAKLIFYFSIPKSYTKKKREQIAKGLLKVQKKPDIDNLVKAVLDALNGVAYLDDKQIHKITAEKRYTDKETGYIELELTGE